MLIDSVSGSLNSLPLAFKSMNSLDITFNFPLTLPRHEPLTYVTVDACLTIGLSLLASKTHPFLRGRPRKVGWGGQRLRSSCKLHFLCQLGH